MKQKKNKKIKMNKEEDVDVIEIFKNILWPFLCACGMAIAGFLEVQGTLENYMNEHFREPDIVYTKEDESEIFSSDIKLKDGNLTLHPQLIIQEDDTIIRVIGLEGIYSCNYLKYEDDITGFKIAKGSWSEVIELADSIKRKLEVQGKNTEAHIVLLMQLEYKNSKSISKKYETIYFVLQDDKVEKASVKEIKKRGREYTLTIDNWKEEFQIIVNDCMNAKLE